MKMPNILHLNNIFDRSNSILNRTYRYQLLATLTVNIITFAHGVGVGWLSPTLTTLQSQNSPLDFSVTISEASWIGSLLGLGSLCGSLIFGSMQNRIGRKLCIYGIALPHICMWILIYSAQSVEFLYVARFLAGLTGGGSFSVIPIYVSEIAEKSIRGTFSTILMLSVNFGILTGFLISTYLSYHVVPFLTVSLPIIYLVLAYFFPETPQYLLKNGKYAAAESSFRFYKNYNNSNFELQKFSQEYGDLKALITKSKNDNILTYRDFTTLPALKSLCTAAFVIFTMQFSGSFAFINYMSNIFAESGSPMDPDSCTIIIGVVQICGAYIATIFVDRYGRKILMLISTGGVTLGLIPFGLFTFYAKFFDLSAYNWVPLVLMSYVIFITHVGITSLTFVLLVEIFPVKIRSRCNFISTAGIGLMVFAALKVLPIIMATFGISFMIWFCGASTLISFVYFAIFLKETKGKSMDAD